MTEAARTFSGRGVVKGEALGRAVISSRPISFLGDIDIRSGVIVDARNNLCGRSIAGSVLVAPANCGSAGSWRVLHQLKRHEAHPVAMIFEHLPDASVVQGAIMSSIPIICAPDASFRGVIRDGDMLLVNGETGTVRVLR